MVAGALFGRAQEQQPSPEASRRECFELRLSPEGAAVGFASLHRTPTPQGPQLEWQIHFPEQELRVWHVETRNDQGARWVWREQQPRRGRTVVAEHAGDRVEVTEWGRECVWRKTLAASGPSCFPLELQELLRRGELAAGELCLFDPLSNEVESVRLVLRPEPRSQTTPGPVSIAGEELLAPMNDRHAELVRADGSLALGWTFRGEELQSFRWQRGGWIAVRVGVERFEAGIAGPALAKSAPEAQPPPR